MELSFAPDILLNNCSGGLIWLHEIGDDFIIYKFNQI